MGVGVGGCKTCGQVGGIPHVINRINHCQTRQMLENYLPFEYLEAYNEKKRGIVHENDR